MINKRGQMLLERMVEFISATALAVNPLSAVFVVFLCLSTIVGHSPTPSYAA